MLTGDHRFGVLVRWKMYLSLDPWDLGMILSLSICINDRVAASKLLQTATSLSRVGLLSG